MKIGILGAGKIGGALGKKWAAAGHGIQFGVRNVQKPEVQELVRSLGSNVTAASIADAINFGEVILFSIPSGAMDETIAANAKALDSKIIIDAANKMGAPVVNSLPTFAKQTPNARVYRAFNNYGWENFENPTYSEVAGDQFFAGPDGEGRHVIETLISNVGLKPVYLGGPDQAFLLDDLLKLWFALAIQQKKGRHLAFKVLTD